VTGTCLHRAILALALPVLFGITPALAEPPQDGFENPFRYCTAVGTLDRPDARWKGPKLPEAITHGLVTLGLVPPNVPPELMRNATWRCMEGKVYVCSYGANLPCDEKADTGRTSSAGMKEFCKGSPSSDFIPAYVTGRATVYAWRCREGAPEVERALTVPDAQNFLSNVWHELTPSQER
jgi:hypothetical protein